MDSLAILQRLGSGQFLEELAEALVKTAAEVVETGKPGKVKVDLTLSTKSQGDPLVIVDEIVSRASPKKDPKGAFFFAVDGALHKDDPRQTVMDFRTIDTRTGEVRSVASDRDERSAT